MTQGAKLHCWQKAASRSCVDEDNDFDYLLPLAYLEHEKKQRCNMHRRRKKEVMQAPFVANQNKKKRLTFSNRGRGMYSNRLIGDKH